MAASGYTEWYFQVFDVRKRTVILDSTGLANVLTQNSPVLLTLFSDDRGTALPQPITSTNGVFRFFTASTTTALDLSGTTANGFSYFLEDATPDDHRIDINTSTHNTFQTMIIPYAVTASGVVADTGRKLSTAMGVRDAYLKIFTAGTSVTIDVGTSTLANSGRDDRHNRLAGGQ